MEDIEKKAIQEVVEKAYIEGIHKTQNEDTIRNGFHKDFVMFVYKDNSINKVSLDEWFDRITKLKVENPDSWKTETTYNIDFIDVKDYSAAVKLHVYKGASLFAIDYMLLYKFVDCWKIVSKIFSLPS